MKDVRGGGPVSPRYAPDRAAPSRVPPPEGRTAHRVYLASALLGDDVLGRWARVRLLRLAGARLAKGAMVHGGTYISDPRRLEMGPRAFIARGCHLDLEADLVLGAGATVGHRVTLMTTRTEPPQVGSSAGSSAIAIGDGAWLGANVVVLAGVTIGPGAVVAAGAMVDADVPANTLVAGSPALRIRSLGPGAG